MERLVPILKNYGPWGLILIVLMHLLINGKVTFEYPYEGKIKTTREQNIK